MRTYHEINRLLDVREDADGRHEYLVKWAGEKKPGVAHADSWQPEANCNAEALRDFEFSSGVLHELRLPGLDLQEGQLYYA